MSTFPLDFYIVKSNFFLTDKKTVKNFFFENLTTHARYAGPREALFHALIRKNYGCTHFWVGRDHAGPSYKKKDGSSFFGPYDAHELLEKYEGELNIKVIKSQWIVYVEDTKSYMRIDQVPEGMKVLNISGTEQRRMLREGEDIPEWFSFPDVVSELKKKFKELRFMILGFI